MPKILKSIWWHPHPRISWLRSYPKWTESPKQPLAPFWPPLMESATAKPSGARMTRRLSGPIWTSLALGRTLMDRTAEEEREQKY